ncbi:hypothetical protein [Massilia sp. Dwa41.01b]|uniref:hypothetical protein n=1 Tax=Massilia sp. Dwa41.01b TaxID=2709302 RepID=UPI00191CA21C|nr:hypothetical protein [Massilia sp. Dwa41.01b]
MSRNRFDGARQAALVGVADGDDFARVAKWARHRIREHACARADADYGIALARAREGGVRSAAACQQQAGRAGRFQYAAAAREAAVFVVHRFVSVSFMVDGRPPDIGRKLSCRLLSAGFAEVHGIAEKRNWQDHLCCAVWQVSWLGDHVAGRRAAG